MLDFDCKKQFEYENGFYLTATVHRIAKLAAHLELYRRQINIPGDIVECGVYKGASLSRFIKFRALFENAYSKKVIAYDTFGEFPPAHYEQDKARRDLFVKEGGSSSISVEQFTELLKRLNLHENVELVKGNIQETAPDYKKKNPHLKISLLHIDVDLYEATKICLEEFYPLVVKGGIVILDDYNKFAGANKAIDEFLKGRNTVINKLPYCGSVSYLEVI